MIVIALVLGVMMMPVAAQEVAECSAGFRLVEHAYGFTCVPENPQQVVILDYSALEFQVVTGMPIVAYARVVMDTIQRMQPELEPQFDMVRGTAVNVGFPPNMEAILSATPDLILAPTDLLSESIYAEVSPAIPTVVYDAAAGDWRTRMVFFGDMLNVSETVDALLADYDARVEELRGLLSETAAETTVSLVRIFPDQIGLVVEGTAGAALLREVGLARPESQTVDYDYVLNELDGRPEILISEEELPLADADVAFVFGDANWLTIRPTWQALPVAQSGQAYVVSYAWWGESLLAAHDMLDDLFAHLAGVKSTIPNPYPAPPVIEATPTAVPTTENRNE